MTGDQNSSCCCNSDNTSEDRDGHEQTDQRRDSAPAMSGGCCGTATPSTDVRPPDRRTIDGPVSTKVAS